MDEGFEIPVTYNNKEQLFAAQLHSYGWSYSIQVDVHGLQISFEKDEEGQWRALAVPEDLVANKKLDIHLLKAIGQAIERILQ